MARFKPEQLYKLFTLIDGTVPEGAATIDFHFDGAGATVDGVAVPSGGYTMPHVGNMVYPEIPYTTNGLDTYIRAYYTQHVPAP